MRVELTTKLSQPPDVVWHRLQTSALLDHIAAPLVRFRPLMGKFPKRWVVGEHRASMLVFGIIPIGQQTIGIEFPEGPDAFVLRDNGHGQLIKTWDHWIFLEPDGEGTRYTDRVDVNAGILTPFVALFAWIFYTHRQRRWRKLCDTDFEALGLNG